MTKTKTTMADKVYVEGGILLTTPYLKYKNAGAGFSRAPEGSIVIPTNMADENGKYLLIDEKHPQSIFDEYYAQTWFAAGTIGTPIFHMTLADAYDQFSKSISSYKLLLNEHLLDEGNAQTMFKLVHTGVLASLDTFVLDCILSKVLNDEIVFKSFASIILDDETADVERSRNERIKWEHETIDEILKKSYSNIGTIKDVFKVLYNISLTDKDGLVKDYIRIRHLIAHRNGRKKDGSIIKVNKADINKIISDVSGFVDQIYYKII